MINQFRPKEDLDLVAGPPVKMTFYMPNGEVKDFAPMPQSQGKRVSREIRQEQLEQYDELNIVLKPVKRH